MTTDAPAPPGFVCLGCARVWTSDGQPETNFWELARAGLELRFNNVQPVLIDGHCDVCDDGKNGPATHESRPAQREAEQGGEVER